MKKLEEAVRSVEQPGLLWGSSKLVAVGYGVSKLQITLVIEDDLVSLDELQEKIAEFEDFVQSTDVAAMQSTSTPICLRLPKLITNPCRALEPSGAPISFPISFTCFASKRVGRICVYRVKETMYFWMSICSAIWHMQ
jgi:translation elongation factor EF-1beta